MSPHADIRDAIDRVVKYGLRSSGPWTEIREARIQQTLGSLFERFDIDGEQLRSRLDNLGALDAYITLGIEDALCIEDPNGSSVLDEYLQRRGFQETPRARRYLEALQASPVRLYEIVAVQPGEWVELRDVAGDPTVRRVSSPAWSHELVPHYRVAGRVVSFDEELVFSNAVLQFDERQGKSLERILARARTAPADERERLAAESSIDAAVLANVASARSDAIGMAVLQFWLSALLDGTLGHDAGLGFDDDDDDDDENLDDVLPVEFYTATMEVDPANTAVIVERLDALPGWKRSRPEFERWTRMLSPDPGPMLQDPEGPLWDISLEGDYLLIESESDHSIRQILSEVRAALGDLAGEPYIMCEEVAAPSDAKASLQAVQHEIYRCLLDEPQPGFGNRTPREHAASEEGRDAVAAWLRTLEEMEIRQAGASGLEPCDLSWIWRELGVERERGRAEH
jgi:hypothetical protein